MLKVLLVDDEINVCTLLKNLIDWESYGFQIIGEAHDGDSAFELACLQQPDILITDIKLPGISGLELVDKIKSAGLSLFIILISGHQKFEYAHTAIQYGVENYLLKPISRQDLIDNLLNIQEKIARQKKEAAIEQVADMTQKKLRRQFMTFLANPDSHLEERSITELNAEYALKLQEGQLQILIIKEDYLDSLPSMQITIIEKKLLDIARKELSPICFDIEGIALNGHCLFFLNYSGDASDISSRLARILHNASEYCESYCKITLGLGESSNVFSYASLETAFLAVSMRMLLGCGAVYSQTDLEKGNHFSLSPNEISQICKNVDVWDTEQILFDMKSLSFQHDIIHSNPPCVIREGKKLLSEVKITLHKMYKDAEIPVSPNGIISGSSLLNNCRSLNEYWNTLTEVIKESLKAFLDVYQQQEQGIVNRAKEFIRGNYHTDISLEDVAAHVHMSTSYFSSVFKKEEGITFIKYLTNFRLSRAKTLLKDSMYNIGEIAEQVGYSDTKYFTKLFKKEVGIKPSEYRKLYTRGHK